MKLLNIEAVLDRDKGIRRAGHDDTEVLNELDDRTTSYAILSHRWKSDSEVSHKEMIRLMKMGRKERKAVKQRDGYRKIIKSCEQAKKDGYKWLWIDTCCIDKRSSAELSEAINSMYRWYRNSRMCYVYLHDVDKLAFPSEQDFSRFDKSNGWPEWFSRGWTLQELIAPRKAEFFNKDWISIGAKQDLTSVLEVITRIPRDVLRDGQVLRSSSSRERPCIAHVMSWASDRKTERVEDRAYSLLGLFGVNMPMLYGEGSKAFQRLQLEIIRVSSDHSIFAWNPRDQLREDGSILADNPSHFEGCHDIEKVPPKKFYRELMRRIGVDVDADQGRLELLRRGVESPQLSRLDVTNLGIEVSLPVIRDPVSNNIEVILPCSDHDGNLVTVDLQPRGHSFGRCFGAARIPKNVTHAEFTSLYLVWSQDTQESYDHQDTEESCYDLRLDDRRALCHGFTRCGSFPREITGDTVTFSSQRNILIVVVYANDNARSRFAVGLGCYLDKVWASIFCDDCPANKEVWSSWEGFAKQAYDILWDGPTHNSCRNTPNTIKDVHLPQSVCDARVICGSSDSGYTNVVIDIQLCPGCCGGSREHTYTSRSYGLWLPWTSRRNRSHKLQLDGEPTEFDLCSDQGIAVGDYGDSPDGNFRRCGNMFKDFGIDLTNSPYRPVASLVTSCSRSPRRVQTQHEAVVTSSSGENMILHQPKGLSLPNNEEFELLLKALSTTLAGKLLVTAVIQCSQFYKVDHEGRRKNLGDASASNGRNRSGDPGTFTLLHVIARPLSWHKEPACSSRREQFINIRKHFYTLVDLCHIEGTIAREESVDKCNTSRGVDLSAMFGLDYLKNFVGKITFFEKLPSIMANQLCSEAFVDTAEGNSLSVRPSNPSSDPRYTFPLLMKCKGLEQWTLDEHRKMRDEIKLISQTLSVGLLRYICITILDVSEDNHSPTPGHSRQADVHSTVQEVGNLQAELQATKDEDEQRALEEDITGKILWFYHQGIRSEVDQILAEVVNYIRNEVNVLETGYQSGLREVIEIIKKVSHVEDDDIIHLQRIMHDAGAGISRHKSWLTSRAAEQARLSRVLKANSILVSP